MSLPYHIQLMSVKDQENKLLNLSDFIHNSDRLIIPCVGLVSQRKVDLKFKVKKVKSACLYQVSTSYGKFTCSSEHVFFVPSGKKEVAFITKTADELNKIYQNNGVISLSLIYDKNSRRNSSGRTNGEAFSILYNSFSAAVSHGRPFQWDEKTELLKISSSIMLSSSAAFLNSEGLTVSSKNGFYSFLLTQEHLSNFMERITVNLENIKNGMKVMEELDQKEGSKYACYKNDLDKAIAFIEFFSKINLKGGKIENDKVPTLMQDNGCNITSLGDKETDCYEMILDQEFNLEEEPFVYSVNFSNIPILVT